MEDVELGLSDYCQQMYVPDFKRAWEEQGEANQVVETYSLTAVQTVAAACQTLIDLLGMQPLEQTQNVKEKSTTHTLLLGGTYLGSGAGVKCLVRCRIACDSQTGVTLEVGCRCSSRDVSERIANCIQ